MKLYEKAKNFLFILYKLIISFFSDKLNFGLLTYVIVLFISFSYYSVYFSIDVSKIMLISIANTTIALLLPSLFGIALNTSNHNKRKLALASILTILGVLLIILNGHFILLRNHINLLDIFDLSIWDLIKTFFNTVNISMLFSIVGAFVITFIAQIKLINLGTQQIQKIEVVKLRYLTLIAAIIGSIYIFNFSEFRIFFSRNRLNTELVRTYDTNYQNYLINQDEFKYLVESDKVSQNNIFVIQLESLTGNLAIPSVTPNLLRISKEGSIIKHLQTGSTSTTRSLEVFFCDVPPSIQKSLAVDTSLTKDLNCLPKQMKELGYKTILLKHSDIDIDGFNEFIHSIGFDEYHNKDIFNDSDQYLEWGYSDEIALQRYFEFLSKQKDEKLFVYMELGAVNHFPFNYYPELNLNVTPLYYKNTLVSNLMTSTKLQDQMLGEAYDKYFIPEFAENTDLLVFGDQSWPVGIHKDNYLNWTNAYEENFVTTLVFRPANNTTQFAKANEIEQHYGTQHIARSIVNIAGGNYKRKKSFYPLLLNNKEPVQELCVLSAQPYADKKLAMVMYPYRYIVDLITGEIIKYNIVEDPKEQNPLVLEDKYTDNKSLIVDECFNNI